MNTEMENGIQMTLEMWMPEVFQMQIAGASERPAKISPLQESERDLTEIDHLSLEKYLESCGKRGKKIDPNGLSMKMLRECCQATGGGDYLSILMEMDELGYDCEWQIFNSKNWGVPQNRERVYTIGHFRAKGSKKILPIGTADGKDSVCPVKLVGHRKNYHRNTQVFDRGGVTETLDTAQGGGRGHHVAIPVNASRSGIGGGYGSEPHPYGEGLQRDRKSGNDSRPPEMFGIDYNVGGEERTFANTIKARYDAGVTNFKQDGTAVCVRIN